MIDKATIASKAKALSSDDLLEEIIATSARRERREILSDEWNDCSAILTVASKELLSRLA